MYIYDELGNQQVKQLNNNDVPGSVSFEQTPITTDPTSKTIYNEQKYGDLPTPTRTGYTFGGWFTEPEYTNEVTSDTDVTAILDHTLYQKWTAIPYTATFDANGGKTPIPTSWTRIYEQPIGGKTDNLWTYGENIEQLNKLSSDSITKELVDDSTSPSGKTVKLTRTTAGIAIAGYYYNFNRLPVGQTYTIKFKAKGSGTWKVGQEQDEIWNITPTSAYTEYSKTFTALDNIHFAIIFYEQSKANGAYIQFYDLEITSNMPVTTRD